MDLRLSGEERMMHNLHLHLLIVNLALDWDLNRLEVVGGDRLHQPQNQIPGPDPDPDRLVGWHLLHRSPIHPGLHLLETVFQVEIVMIEEVLLHRLLDYQAKDLHLQRQFVRDLVEDQDPHHHHPHQGTQHEEFQPFIKALEIIFLLRHHHLQILCQGISLGVHLHRHLHQEDLQDSLAAIQTGHPEGQARHPLHPFSIIIEARFPHHPLGEVVICRHPQ